MDIAALTRQVRTWALELGFDSVRIGLADPGEHAAHLRRWLARGFHAEMGYMARNVALREHPERLLPGAIRVVSVRMNYLPPDDDPDAVLEDPDKAYVARYALGRDYHKVMRRRLARLGRRLEATCSEAGHRAVVDSAPVLEKGLAERAGLGWIGKNTLLLDTGAGSFFFLGELLTTVPLETDPATERGHCGSCRACLDACPTGAIVAPGVLDAGRCIAYLTIEHRGAIPEALRPAIGNRIFGCDDCQLVCPWNRQAARSGCEDFRPRHGLAGADLLELFAWDEATFLARTEGMALRRISFRQWRRNLAIALGNAPPSAAIREALAGARDRDPMVREHIDWAVARQSAARSESPSGEMRALR